MKKIRDYNNKRDIYLLKINTYKINYLRMIKETPERRSSQI